MALASPRSARQTPISPTENAKLLQQHNAAARQTIAQKSKDGNPARAKIMHASSRSVSTDMYCKTILA